MAPGGLFGNLDGGAAHNDENLEKLSRKVKTKETEIKQMKSELLEKKNQASKAELKLVKMEA